MCGIMAFAGVVALVRPPTGPPGGRTGRARAPCPRPPAPTEAVRSTRRGSCAPYAVDAAGPAVTSHRRSRLVPDGLRRRQECRTAAVSESWWLLVTVGVVATGCSVVTKVKQDVHNVEGNKATIDSFTQNLQSNQGHALRSDLHHDGESPGHRRLRSRPLQRRAGLPRDPDRCQRVEPPADRELVRRVHVQPERLGRRLVVPEAREGRRRHENKIFDVYTPSHWIAFLKGVSLVAGLAGDKVTSSTMSLNGFDMNCVDLVAHGVPGTSTICSTSQGILGYVKVASDSTSFRITNYSSSPAASLFQLPPGATVTTVTTT